MSEQKDISGSMRMAKADQEDLDTAYQVMNLLDSMSRGYYPSNEEGSPTFFDSDNWEHLQFLHQQIIQIAENSGGVSRVIGAAGIFLSEKNGLIDPDDDCIELHPDLKAKVAAFDALSTTTQDPEHRIKIDLVAAIKGVTEFFDGEFFCITGTSEAAEAQRGQRHYGDDSAPFDHLYVDQDGGGITGDDFHGTVHFHIGGDKYLKATY